MFTAHELETVETLGAYVQTLESQATAMVLLARQARAALTLLERAVERVKNAADDASQRQTPPKADGGEASTPEACVHPAEARIPAPVMGAVRRFHCRQCRATVNPELEATA